MRFVGHTRSLTFSKRGAYEAIFTKSELRSTPVKKAASANAPSKLPATDVLVDGIFADVDFVITAFPVIKELVAGEEEFGRYVPVGIYHIDPFMTVLTTQSECRDEFQLRIFFLDGFIEFIVTLFIDRTPVFVADLDIFQRERCRMPVFRRACGSIRSCRRPAP